MSPVFKSAAILIALAALVLAGLALFSAWQAARIEARFPNKGELIDVGGLKLNSLMVEAGADADLPPLVFIHGASGNLADPMGAFLDPLRGRAQMLFVDRPGHGYSERGGADSVNPGGQADAIARLMEKRGIAKAIIIGHSFGGAIAAALALRHPERVAGLLFLSPATHPWPGGIDWYYDLANVPVLGEVFCQTLATPAGLMRLEGGVKSVFSPNPVPAGYLDTAGIALVLRPKSFCNNARDVANLLAWVKENQPLYATIAAPTVIVTGDSDDIVLEELHSRGLARDIKGAELVWVHNLGHKPDYIATSLSIAAIEKIAGMPRDLATLARDLESRIAHDGDGR
jgi:pimeloyl-ACP methyl ester carboxylesterase